jgi:hypothetical protein
MIQRNAHEAERYAAAWRDRRRRWWVSIALAVAVLPAMYVCDRFFRVGFTIVVPLLACLASAAWVLMFRCPRCARLFSVSWRLESLGGEPRHCVHCKLPLNAPRYPDGPPRRKRSRVAD